MLINFGLCVLSVVLSAIFFPIGLIYTFLKALFLGSPRKAVGYLSNMLLAVALAIDIMGNTVCRDLLNDTMIKPEGHRFGSRSETISAVLGKNKLGNTLLRLGNWLAEQLNRIDPDHVERAAKAATCSPTTLP